MNQQLRYKLADYLLQQEIKQSRRQTKLIPFKNAGSIGILYDATLDNDYEIIKNYVKELRASSKDVLALGYFNQKELPGTRFMKLGLDFFTKKSLNWKLKPNHPIVNNFMQRNFDILICLSLEKSIPLRYVSCMTNAGFKIGKYDRQSAGIYDFMIKVEEKPTLRQMIDQVNHYLNLIRNEKYQEA